MNKIKILTPDNIEIEYKLASLPLRAAAAGIDMLIQMAVFGLFVVVGIIIMDIDSIFSVGPNKKEMTILAVLLIIYGLIMYGYYVFFDIFMKGQTIGKRLYHIRVIRENGEGISILHAIIREFLRITIDAYGIGVIMVFLNKRYKRLGDVMASTIVVSEDIAYQSYHNYSVIDNRYNIDDGDAELIKDYLSRKHEINLYEKELLEERLIKYITEKYGISKGGLEREAFLKSII